ncbi:MAG: hypothetical protein BWX64_02107 [Acidobacteria bacterium ADurb.Bin051]|nr:MAG: hypothetical protein BWX64_02107 [Acidobacteria bacterium ADurb.Bin051]
MRREGDDLLPGLRMDHEPGVGSEELQGTQLQDRRRLAGPERHAGDDDRPRGRRERRELPRGELDLEGFLTSRDRRRGEEEEQRKDEETVGSEHRRPPQAS